MQLIGVIVINVMILLGSVRGNLTKTGTIQDMSAVAMMDLKTVQTAQRA